MGALNNVFAGTYLGRTVAVKMLHSQDYIGAKAAGAFHPAGWG